MDTVFEVESIALLTILDLQRSIYRIALTATSFYWRRVGLQVEIPQPLNYLLVGLAFSDFVLAWTWEHLLRRSFPAAKPPQKPYLAHAKELEALRSSRGLEKLPHPHVD